MQTIGGMNPMADATTMEMASQDARPTVPEQHFQKDKIRPLTYL